MLCTPHQRSHKVTRYEPLVGQRGANEFYTEGTETSPTDGVGRRKSVLPSLPTASVLPLQDRQMYVNQPITSVASRLHRAYNYERTTTKQVRAVVNLYICMWQMLG